MKTPTVSHYGKALSYLNAWSVALYYHDKTCIKTNSNIYHGKSWEKCYWTSETVSFASWMLWVEMQIVVPSMFSIWVFSEDFYSMTHEDPKQKVSSLLFCQNSTLRVIKPATFAFPSSQEKVYLLAGPEILFKTQAELLFSNYIPHIKMSIKNVK